MSWYVDLVDWLWFNARELPAFFFGTLAVVAWAAWASGWKAGRHSLARDVREAHGLAITEDGDGTIALNDAPR